LASATGSWWVMAAKAASATSRSALTSHSHPQAAPAASSDSCSRRCARSRSKRKSNRSAISSPASSTMTAAHAYCLALLYVRHHAIYEIRDELLEPVQRRKIHDHGDISPNIALPNGKIDVEKENNA